MLSSVDAIRKTSWHVDVIVIFNPFRGKPTCRPRLKGILTYVILTYTGTETHVVWVIYTRNPLFRVRVKFFSPLKG